MRSRQAYGTASPHKPGHPADVESPMVSRAEDFSTVLKLWAIRPKTVGWTVTSLYESLNTL